MNNADYIIEEAFKCCDSLENEYRQRAVSLACSINLASIIQNNSDFSSDRHPPEDHIYWETRENVMEKIRNTPIKIAHVLRITKRVSLLNKVETTEYAKPTWDDVKSNQITIQEVMET